MKSKTVSTLAVKVIGPHCFCCIMSFYYFVLMFCLFFQILDLSVCISSQRVTTLKTTRSICSSERTPSMESKSVKPHMPESDSCARYRYTSHIHTPKDHKYMTPQAGPHTLKLILQLRKLELSVMFQLCPRSNLGSLKKYSSAYNFANLQPQHFYHL